MQISTSNKNTSFTELMKTLDSREVQNLIEDDWIQMLLDHREYLVSRSVWLPLTEEVLLRYRYRIRDFLKNAGYDQGAEQAFRICNRLHNDHDFKLGLDGVWMPTNDDILELRKKYNTLKAQIAQLD